MRHLESEGKPLNYDKKMCQLRNNLRGICLVPRGFSFNIRPNLQMCR